MRCIPISRTSKGKGIAYRRLMGVIVGYMDTLTTLTAMKLKVETDFNGDLQMTRPAGQQKYI